MYVFLGWLTVILAAWNLTLFVVRRVWKIWRKRQTTKEKKTPPAWLKYWLKAMQHTHPITGMLMLATGLAHGYLALGQQIMMHTGLLVWLGVIALFGIRIVGIMIKSFRRWRMVHTALDFVFWGLLILHLTNPWLIY